MKANNNNIILTIAYQHQSNTLILVYYES
jgi:hypothetical protein